MVLYLIFGKKHFIVLFTLFPGLTPALIIHENVVFHKANEIALTRSKWLSTFIIDFLNKLPEDLGKAKITAHRFEQFNDFSSKQDYKGIIKGLKGEIVAYKMTNALWWEITYNCMPYIQK